MEIYAVKSNTDREFLLYLARNVESNKYDIHKKSGKSYSNVYNSIKYLLEKGLIEKTRSEPGKKNRNMKVDYYRLTDAGWMPISGYKPFWQHIDEIAERNESKLPLIFGKWDFFRKNAVLDEITAKLQTAFYVVWRRYDWETLALVKKISNEAIKVRIERIKESKDKEGSQKFLERHDRLTNVWREITDLTFGVEASYLWPTEYREDALHEGIKQFQDFLEVLSHDVDLQSYIEKTFERSVETQRKYYENLLTWKKWHNNLKVLRDA